MISGQIASQLTLNTMETQYILWLNQAEAASSARVGCKAANLIRLSQAGLSVPDGFCITTKAYCDFLDALAPPGAVSPQDTGGEGLARLTTLTPLPVGLHAQVVEAYHRLQHQHGPDVKVAVRSSATIEDLPGASFAGQYVSILNVTNQGDLIEAIKQCWLSASSPQVRTYRTQHQLHDVDVQMAVIVQVMVHPDFAGVLFTVEPLASNPAQMAIEMAPGLGDDIVSGRVMPGRFTIERQGQKIASLSPRSWPKSMAAPIARTNWVPLFDLALQIEELFQAPQDIEWAYSGHRFWILQSRPITGHSQSACRQIWTRANAGEILPGVVSPLTWSIFKPILQTAGQYRAWSPLTIHWRWQHPCGQWPDSPRLFQGRAYMELASVYASFGNLPGVSLDVLQRMLGFEFHLCRADEIPKKCPRWHVMDPYRAMRFWIEMLGLTKTLPQQARHWLEKEIEPGADIAAGGSARPQTTLHSIDRLQKEAARVLGLHIQCTSMAFSAFGLVDRLIRHYVEPEVAQAFEAGLMADFRGISTVQQGIAIWDLAQATRQLPPVYDALFRDESPERIIKAWRDCPEAAGFVSLWDSFIDHFGDRSTQEFELSVAHWNEDPVFVIQMMRDILCSNLLNPTDRLSRQLESSHQQLQKMTTYIDSQGSSVDTWLWSRLIAAYKTYVSLRENLKYAVVSRFNVLRRMFVDLGRLFELNGLIAEHNDIFFLRYEEISILVKNGLQPSLDTHALVAQRKEEYREWAQLPAPDIWISAGEQDTPMQLPQQQAADAFLQGIGCSPGLVTGKAFVLASIQGDVAALPGQILVAPSMEPGLTPLFLASIGLVTEIGGMLSHGATVAREYGLPAVVGVPHATKLIKNGQLITVDGFTGQVYLGVMAGE